MQFPTHYRHRNGNRKFQCYINASLFSSEETLVYWLNRRPLSLRVYAFLATDQYQTHATGHILFTTSEIVCITRENQYYDISNLSK